MRTAPILFLGVILGGLVWYFAIIGLLTVTSAAPIEAPRPPATRLLPPGEVAGQDIADIPRYPDAQRAEYRRTAFEDVTYIETEYLTDASIDDVRAFYRSQLDRHGWRLVNAQLDRGESVYVVVKEPHMGRIEIEAVDGVVEIEIELDLAGLNRGSTTDR